MPTSENCPKIEKRPDGGRFFVSLFSEYQAGGGKPDTFQKFIFVLTSETCGEFEGFRGLTRNLEDSGPALASRRVGHPPCGCGGQRPGSLSRSTATLCRA